MKKAIMVRETWVTDHLLFVDPEVDEDILEELCDKIERKENFDDVAYMFERALGDQLLGIQREYFEDIEGIEYWDEFDSEED